VIAVDTNILARFTCDDSDDAEAKRQRPIALGRPLLPLRATSR